MVSGNEGRGGAKEGNSGASPFGLRFDLPPQRASSPGTPGPSAERKRLRLAFLGRSTPASKLAGDPGLPQAGIGRAVGAWTGGALRNRILQSDPLPGLRNKEQRQRRVRASERPKTQILCLWRRMSTREGKDNSKGNSKGNSKSKGNSNSKGNKQGQQQEQGQQQQLVLMRFALGVSS